MEEITKKILQDLLTPVELEAHVAADGPRGLQDLHAKEEAENNASDADGEQGGQRWSPPTKSPSQMPSEEPTSFPTVSPTYHPTVRGEPFVFKGTVWYDQNANGNRDVGVSSATFGSEVEYSVGLGGVQVTLIECDPSTNREIEASADTIATTISQGFMGRMEPMLSIDGGEYRLVNIQIDRSYAVRVEAPTGYLFSSGVCNDNERGWKCQYSRGNNRNLQYDDTANIHSKDHTNKKQREFAMGISSGRSTECITIDRQGIPNKAVDFGILRVGDTKAEETDVALVLDFDGALAQGRRGLKDMLRDAIELPRSEGDSSTVRRYLLGEVDKRAIGSVTAEVLASKLDKRLAENSIVLDGVDPQDVILSDDSEVASKEVAIALNIKGHYSPPPELDFDYIVNDSINSDTEQIRRDLKAYNENCRAQTAKVQSGSSISDFDEVYSMTGANKNKRVSNGDVYRTVCAEGEKLPIMFETSLKEISATSVSEIGFGPVFYVNSGLAGWATGPTAAIGGLIALLMGMFVFRRALGPRKVDKYRQQQKTGLIDAGDDRRFGEMGGDVDDGSVDSAFYSSSDDDYSGDETKDKEKKMRAKLRAEAEKSKMNGKSSKKFSAKLKAEAEKMSGKSSKKFSAKLKAEAEKMSGKTPKKFASKNSKKVSKSSKNFLEVKSGVADDTDSIPSSQSAKDSNMKRSKKSSKSPKDVPDSTDKKSVHSSKSSTNASVTSVKSQRSRSSTRGRDRSKGGDNAKVVASIV